MSVPKIIIKDVPLSQIKVQETFKRVNSLHDADEYKKNVAELAMSIRENGLLQPVILFQLSPKKYELYAGERRFNAFRFLKERTIPSSILTKENALVTIIENIQRVDLTNYERGLWMDIAVKLMMKEQPKLYPNDESCMSFFSTKFGKAKRTLYDWRRAATDSTEEEKRQMKSGKVGTTQVNKNIKERTNKTKARQTNKGQEIKRKKKAFITANEKMIDLLKYIGKNAVEFKTDDIVKAELKKLIQFSNAVSKKIDV